MKLWGNADSVNVQKIIWCCEEIGLACERIDAGRHFGVVNTPAFLALNPNGLVPTIDDDGFVLWESNAILRYVAAQYAAGTLWPLDAQERALADRWLDWSNATLWPALLPLFRAFYRTAENARKPEQIAADLQAAIKVMKILDAQLQLTPYLGGAAFTMGDIAVGCAAWRWFAMPIERPELPGLQQWFERLSQRPAYRKAVMMPLG